MAKVMEPKLALFCGSRDWRDEAAIRQVIDALPKDSIVVHGAARGADTIAGRLARQRGLVVRSYPAQWGRWGRKAGVLRNQQMLDAERPDIVYAFQLNNSKGTGDMIRRARKALIAVVVLSKEA
jgi:hypothetical protein